MYPYSYPYVVGRADPIVPPQPQPHPAPAPSLDSLFNVPPQLRDIASDALDVEGRKIFIGSREQPPYLLIAILATGTVALLAAAMIATRRIATPRKSA
jgi:hypothetical protein